MKAMPKVQMSQERAVQAEEKRRNEWRPKKAVDWLRKV